MPKTGKIQAKMLKKCIYTEGVYFANKSSVLFAKTKIENIFEPQNRTIHYCKTHFKNVF